MKDVAYGIQPDDRRAQEPHVGKHSNLGARRARGASPSRGGHEPASRPLGRVAWAAFALVVLALAGSFAYGYLFADAARQMEQADRPWYGNWGTVAFAVAFFSIFVLAFLRSPQRREWRHLGVTEAYLVALFAEMFGLPLTIFLLASVLGVNLGLSGLEGHLWAVVLDRLGLLPLERGVAAVMAVSSVLIIFGLALMAAGWWQVWRARGELVTSGLYRFTRHPQYFGVLMVVVGFLVQWPTLPTLVLFPVLLFAYVRLARREERQLAAQFGERWEAYRGRTPMLLPLWPGRAG